MPKYIIREAHQDDISGITGLRHTIREFRTIDTDEYISFWNAHINNNPHSIRHAFVGVNDKNEIVAHMAMVPYRFLKDGKPLFGGSLCQQMVHEDFRQELLFLQMEMKILRSYKDAGMDFAFGLANRSEVKKAHLSFGFCEFGDLVVYAIPYKLSGIARRFINNNTLNALIMPVLSIADKFLRLKRAAVKGDMNATEILRFDSGIDPFLTEAQKHFPYSSIRTSTLLNWRFAGSPAVKYHILVTKEKGIINGYVVLRRTNMKGFDVLAIVDILFPPDQSEVGKSLIKAVHKKAMQLDVDMSACLLNPFDPLSSIIKKAGFFKTPETFSLIVHEPGGREPLFNKDSFPKWHLTWFDHDAL